MATAPACVDRQDASPQETLLRAEACEAIAAALADLPEPYRQVLDLRFVHGLRSVQIARSLGRSPETVRTQVRRGLEHLRRLLPKGLAVPVALFAVRGRGLAAVRSAVLAQVRVAPVTAFSGAWLLVVLAALWAAGRSLWGAAVEPAPAPAVAVVVPGRTQGASRPVETATRAAVREPERAAPPARAAGQVVAPMVPGRIRGRCIADENGMPIAGARVQLKRFVVPETPECQSAGDGRFALEFEPWARNGCSALLRVDAPGRAWLNCSFAQWAAGQELDVGDVRMPRGVTVRGQVHDQTGAPVAGVGVVLDSASKSDPLPFGNQAGAQWSRMAETDAQGRFLCDGAMASGTFVVGVQERTVVGARTVTLQWEERERDLQLVVATQDPSKAIRGRCVDPQGQPFASVEIWLCSPNGNPNDPRARFHRTSSDERGAFVLPHEDSFPERPTVRFAAELAQPKTGERADVAWGSKDLVLVLQRKPAAPAEPTAEVEIEVVDAAGAPVEDFALRCMADPRQSCRFLTHLGALRMGGHHPGGKVVVSASTRWRNVLFVEPEDARFMPVGPVFFAGDQGRVRAVVRRSAELRVRVQSRAGAPVANTTVELLRPWAPEAVTLFTKAVPLRDPFGVLQMVWAVRVGEVITDADGIAAFTAGAGETGLVLRSSGPKTRPFVVADVTAGREVVPVTAELGGILSGQLVGWDQVRRRLGRVALALCRRGAPRLDSGPQFLVPRWTPREDGSYRIEGAETGAWDVHLLRLLGDPRPASFGEEIQFSTRLDPPLASVVLEDGQPQTLDLDLRPLAPGRIDGQLLLDGRPLAHTRWTIDPDGTARRTLPGGTTDRDGRFTLDPALAGTHWLVIQWSEPASGKALRLSAREPITVDVGETVPATVELHSEDAEDTAQVLRRMMRGR